MGRLLSPRVNPKPGSKRLKPLDLRSLAELTRSGAEQKLREIRDRIAFIEVQRRQARDEEDYEWYSDSGRAEEVEEQLFFEAFTLLRKFPDLMRLDAPLKFSSMTRQDALHILDRNEASHSLSHDQMGDRWYSHPLHHALKAESAFLRENLNRFSL